MIRQPTRTTRTDTRLPCTTIFRSYSLRAISCQVWGEADDGSDYYSGSSIVSHGFHVFVGHGRHVVASMRIGGGRCGGRRPGGRETEPTYVYPDRQEYQGHHPGEARKRTRLNSSH